MVCISHSHFLKTDPGTKGVKSDTQSQARVLPSRIHRKRHDARWDHAKCSCPPDVTPERGFMLTRKGEATELVAVAFLKGAFWCYGQYNDRADLGSRWHYKATSLQWASGRSFLDLGLSREPPPPHFTPVHHLQLLHHPPHHSSRHQLQSCRTLMTWLPHPQSRTLACTCPFSLKHLLPAEDNDDRPEGPAELLLMLAPCPSTWDACWGLIRTSCLFSTASHGFLSLCSILHFSGGWHHSAVKIISLKLLGNRCMKPPGLWILFITEEAIYLERPGKLWFPAWN